jgi:hypothetical protein
VRTPFASSAQWLTPTLQAIMRRLLAMQRAYLMSFRRAKARAKVERDQLADEFYEMLDDVPPS